MVQILSIIGAVYIASSIDAKSEIPFVKNKRRFIWGVCFEALALITLYNQIF